MSRFSVNMFFGVALGVALLSLTSGPLADQHDNQSVGQDRFCPRDGDDAMPEDDCGVNRGQLDAIVDRAYRLGYNKGYEAGVGQGALYYWDPLGKGGQMPNVQFHDRGTGPLLLVPPRGTPGSR